MMFTGHERLMLFYLLPHDLVKKATALAGFPRDPHKVLTNQHWRKLYYSDYFEELLIDGWAWMIWPHLGIKGSLESFSGYDPFWRLVHGYSLWIRVLSIMGVTAEIFFNSPPGYEIEFFSYEKANQIAQQIAEVFKRHSKFNEMLEVVKAHRAHEDFDYRHSRAKIDFHRKYYHSRANVKMVELKHAADVGYSAYGKIEGRIDFDRFLKSQDETNQEIIRLLLAGYNQREIAEIIGFANHSAVSKRVNKIGKQLKEFMMIEQ